MGDLLLRVGVTIFLVADPLGFVPFFLAITQPLPAVERPLILRRAILLAFLVGVVFVAIGGPLLDYLGISLPAFTIAGGILLMIMAMEMLFGHRALFQMPVEGESGTLDIAVFPLAVPMLCGPGTIAAILLFLSSPQRPPLLQLWIVLAWAVTLALCWVLTSLSQPLLNWLGEGGIQIVTRVMGILLAGLAVQFVLTGIGEYVTELRAAL